jgi:hypothetical protein
LILAAESLLRTQGIEIMYELLEDLLAAAFYQDLAAHVC